METTLDNKLSILSELWLDYRDDEEFTDFIEYNDLGLPLAYAISNDIVSISSSAEKFIGETFDLLLAALDLEDTGYADLTEVLEAGSQE
jgi:hypothetical protein